MTTSESVFINNDDSWQERETENRDGHLLLADEHGGGGLRAGAPWEQSRVWDVVEVVLLDAGSLERARESRKRKERWKTEKERRKQPRVRGSIQPFSSHLVASIDNLLVFFTF